MVRLTQTVKTSGCAAKLPPGVLAEALSSLPQMQAEKLLVGFETSDDCLAWDLGEGRVMVQSIDFFPPVADDPFDYGQVAAANALSDIWAMGAEPAVCMNAMCFPSCMDLSVMKGILRGAQDKVAEAGAVIAGGHTIADSTIKFGLSVTGFTTKDRLWKNKGALPGDVLVLTKKLGAGIANTANKAEMCPEETCREALAGMKTLNKRAFEHAKGLRVHAATDITGFSFLGHLSEMASASGVSATVDISSVPVIGGVPGLAKLGLIPEGAYHNADHFGKGVEFDSSVPRHMRDILFDPQTSGGLALAMPPEDAEAFLASFGEPARIVAKFTERSSTLIAVK